MSKKIAIVTCYFDPDYVRARTLRSGLESIPNFTTIIVKNRYRNFLRYPEIMIRLIFTRLRHQPDVYLLTFRGQEILPFMLLLTWQKPLIFDEFIVPLIWATEKHREPTLRNKSMKLFAQSSAIFYKSWLHSCRFIIADTQTHAELSAKLSGVDRTKYRIIPVGTDESIFKPETKPTKTGSTMFQVFYYGNMLPLHGLDYVLQAAIKLRTEKNIQFLIIGGGKSTKKIIRLAQDGGAHIRYESWIPFEQLPEIIAASDVCLAGPFGNTTQAQHVITGKTYQFLACIAPTIVGQNEASAELFKDKVNCLVCKQADSEALAESIIWAAQHPHELTKIAAAGHRLYERNFSSQVIAKQLNVLLDEVV